MRVLTVNVVEELIPGPKETGFTAIDKRPQRGGCRSGELGLAGTGCCDTKNHGGPDQAIYAYAGRTPGGGPRNWAGRFRPGCSGRTCAPRDSTSPTR